MIGRTNAVNKPGAQFYLTVYTATNAIVTATKGSQSISATAVSGECLLVLPEAGTWGVAGELNGEEFTSKTISLRDNYEITLPFVSLTLNENSWETIGSVSSSGEAANYWSIGDRKEITLNGTIGSLALSTYSTYAFIIGFNHNEELEGNNLTHFQLGKTDLPGETDICLCDSLYGTSTMATGFTMNSNKTSSGGWSSSSMRKSVCGNQASTGSTFLSAIPSELRTALKPVTKYTDNSGNGSTAASAVTATTDYVFLLSEYEVFGSVSRANPSEADKQAQYDFYSAGNSKVKYRHDSETEWAAWWLRSPYATTAGYFAGVSANGTATNMNANSSWGFSPGFCL